MLHALQMAERFGWPLAALGVMGLLASIACIAVASAKRDSRFVFLIANVPMFFALASCGLGIVGVALGHSNVHAALAAAPDMPSIGQRILYEGYKEAVYRAWAGLVSGAAPFLFGIGVVGLGFARKRGAGGAAMPIVIGAFAMAVAVISIVVGLRPLPGIDFSDAPSGARDVYDAQVFIERGDEGRGCEKLVAGLEQDPQVHASILKQTTQLDPAPNLSAIMKYAPHLAALATTCAERFVRNMEENGNTLRLDDFRSIEVVIDPPARKDFDARIQQAFAAAHPSAALGTAVSIIYSDPPQPVEGETKIVGRLPPEMVHGFVRRSFGRLWSCYESGRKRKPNLAGRVVVTFTITNQGTVSGVDDSKSDLADAETLACIARVFKSLTFPPPDGGTVTVTYPITFSMAK